MRKIYFFLCLFSLTNLLNLVAQTGNEFWFAVPEVSYQHNPAGGEPTILRVTALDLPVQVTLSMPKTDQTLFPPIVRNIAPYGTVNIDLTPWIRTGTGVSGIPPLVSGIANDNNIIESGLHTEYGVVRPKGMLLEVTGGDVTAYLEKNNPNNKEIFALKAKNALGTDFWLVGQNFFQNHNYTTPPTLSAYDIVATEDGTVVTIKLPTGKSASRIGWNTAGGTYTISLDRGEVFSIAANSRSVADHLDGTHVTTDAYHPIAIMWKDDSIDNNTTNGWDLCGDQLVPTNLAGKKYIVMRGNLGVGLTASQTCSEFAFVTTTTPNTSVVFKYFNNVSGLVVTDVPVLVPLAGTMIRKQLNEGRKDATKPTIDALYIEASEPVLVSHISGTGFEMGGAVIPRIDGCTGSLKATINRSSADSVYLNIMTKEAHIDDFRIVISGNEYLIPPAWFTKVPGTTGMTPEWYYLDKAFNNFSSAHGGIPAIPFNTATMVYNTTGLFHLGMLNGNAAGGAKYGYFSNFSDDFGSAGIGATGTDYFKYCFGDTIQLQSSGGASYLWDYASTPYIDNTFIDGKTSSHTRVAPPPGFHTYDVQITRTCYSGALPDTIIQVSAYGYPEIKASFDTLKIIQDNDYSFEMKYHNNSIGSNKYEWTFERVYDTIKSTLVNPEIVYYNNTTYTTKNVKTSLRASYLGNCPDSTTKIITIKPKIKAQCTIGVKTGCQQVVNQSYYLDTVGSGPITSVYWNWGDGTETEYKVSNLGELPLDSYHRFHVYHTYTNLTNRDTTFFVTLVYIDSVHGSQDTLNPPFMHAVLVPGVARARFTVDKSYGYSPLSVAFQNRSNGDVSYEWDFGNGSPIKNTGSDTVVTFTNSTTIPVQFEINLSITKSNNDGSSCFDNYKDTITVYPHNISDSVLTSGCKNFVSKEYYLKMADLGPFTSIYWNWGDGSETEIPASNLGNFTLDSSLGYNFNHTFINYNKLDTSFYVTLVIIDSLYDTRDTLSPPYMDTVYVPSLAKASFTVDIDKGCSPLTVQFKNNSLGNVSYEWDFGDGGLITNTGKDTTLTFVNSTTVPRDYNINLLIIKSNNDGTQCFDSYLDTVTVYPEFVTTINPAASSEGCNPLLIDYSQTTTPNIPNLQYVWDFGDGSTSSSANPAAKMYSHTLPTDQIYTTTLTTTSEYNCKSVSTPHYINVYSYVDANFTLDDTSGCSPLSVAVQNHTLSYSYNNFSWTIPSGNIGEPADDINPFVVTYENKTTANIVKTIILNNSNLHGCTQSFSKYLTIYPEVTSLFNKSTDTICDNASINFTNQSFYSGVPTAKITNATPDAQFTWSFSDGTTINSENTSKVFRNTRASADAEPQVFYVTLTVSINGCVSTYIDSIFVKPSVTAELKTVSEEICSPDIIQLFNNSKGANHYIWDFSDGTTSIATNNNDPLMYEVKNTSINDTVHKTVFLTAINENCSNKTSITLKVYPRLIPKIVAPITEGCNGLEMSFTNATMGGNTINPLTYIWDFGDGTSSTSNNTNILHSYTNNYDYDLTYTVTLTAQNAIGCAQTDELNVTIHPSPKIELGADLTGCFDEQIMLDAGSGFKSYSWNTGEGSQQISITQSGFYSVKVTDLNGCSNADSINIVIHELPALDLGSDLEGCLGQQFMIDAGSGFESYAWNTGELLQQISVSENGTYSVEVTNIHGCKKSDTLNVHFFHIPVCILPYDTIACQGDTLLLDAGLFTSYLWNNESTNRMIEVFETGVYNVHITDNNGCSTTHSINATFLGLPIADFYYSIEKGMVTFLNTSQNSSAYYWDFGDTLGFSSTINPTYEYSKEGTYKIVLVAKSEFCNESSTSKYILIAGLSINDSDLNSFSIYPNPTNKCISIERDSKGNKPSEIIAIEFLSTDGCCIKKEIMDSEAKTIDTEDLKPGLYLLRLTSNKNVIYYKIIKN